MPEVGAKPQLGRPESAWWLHHILTPVAAGVTLIVGLQVLRKIHDRVQIGMKEWLMFLSLVVGWFVYIVVLSSV